MAAPTLPNELYLEILSHCDYFTLKACLRVNKTFKSFIALPEFDNQLFRTGQDYGEEFPDNPTPRRYCDVHPALHTLTINPNQTTRLQSVNSSRYDLTADVEIEYATYPCVGTVYLRSEFSGNLIVSAYNWRGGVTVGDVFDAIDEYVHEPDVDAVRMVWYLIRPTAPVMADSDDDVFLKPKPQIRDFCVVLDPAFEEFYDYDSDWEAESEESGGEVDSGSEAEESGDQDDSGEPTEP